jgi:hypothetical protein
VERVPSSTLSTSERFDKCQVKRTFALLLAL